MATIVKSNYFFLMEHAAFGHEGEGRCVGVMYLFLPLGQSTVPPVPTGPIRTVIEGCLCRPSYCHLLSCPVRGHTG